MRLANCVMLTGLLVLTRAGKLHEECEALAADNKAALVD